MSVWWTLWVAYTLCWPAVLGLDAGYYLHLVRGQARIVLNQQPIEKLLRRPDLDASVREKLRLVQDIRQFAQGEIGLSRSDNYTTFFDTGDGPVSWNLTACPKDRLQPVQWQYPVVGSAPYRGYFDRDRAEREQAKLEAEGYDTYLRPVSAYSTLGWFRDPVLSPMLRYRDEALADVLIHELTHATVWVPGHVPFNESLATFVGETGSLLWLETRYGPGASVVKEAYDLRADQQLFADFMQGIVRGLEALYGRDLPYEEKLRQRQAVFDGARDSFASLPLRTNAYQSFPRWELNNARMVAYRAYHSGPKVFERVYQAVGRDLRAAVVVFKGCENAEDPMAYLDGWVQAHNPGSRESDP